MIKETFKKLRAWYEKTMNSLMEIEPVKPKQQEVKKPKAAPLRYTINVCIGEQTLSLKVTEATERQYREVAKRLNDDYQNYRQQFPDASSERLLAILALKEGLSKTSK